VSQRASESRVVALTVILALLLTLMPLPESVQALRPHWLALVLIYWHLEGRRLRTMGGAFALGLLLDVMTGTLLGQHALGLVVLVYLLERFHAQIRFFPPWQQAAVVFALLFNDRIVHLWVVGIAGEGWPQWSWWLSPLVSVAVWPWLFLLLDRMRRQMRAGRAGS
jgi:rod shape-determining protein MreD